MSPRTASSAPPTLVRLDPGGGPAYRQIADSLRDAIRSGRLRPGARVPGTRLLAAELRVSRNTVNGAVSQLLAEGYLVSRPRAGLFVHERLPDALLAVAHGGSMSAGHRHGGAGASVPPRRFRRSETSLALSKLPLSAGRSLVQPARPFQTGVPALDAFPWGLWARIASRHTRRFGPLVSGYGPVLGHLQLREAIAGYVSAARGARCSADQIVVTAGAQQGLDLVARVLVDRGDTVWLEDPGYPAARGVFAAAGARLVPIGLDAEGLRPHGAELAAGARLVYTTPSRQYPTGITMSAARRMELLAWAAAAGAWIVEDDYDSEFRYASRPLHCLQGLDESGQVIYVGTFSKTVFPGLRLGYLIVPPDLVDAFRDVRAVADRQPPGIEQAVLAEFIADGHLARHVRRMRALYEERRDALLAAARASLPETVEFGDTAAGMLALARLPPGLNDLEVSQRALQAGVEAPALSSYAVRPQVRAGLLLGYAGYPPAALGDAMRRLAGAIRASVR